MFRKFVLACAALFTIGLSANATFRPKEVIPSDNSTVRSLSVITVIWPGEWLESVSFDVCGSVKNSDGEVVATLTAEENFGYDGAAACDFLLSETVSDPGVYTVYVDANCVESEDEEGNEMFQLTYTVGDISEVSLKFISADPENGSTVPNLSRIKTYWSDKVTVVNSDIKCRVLDGNGDVIDNDVTVSKGVFSTDPVTVTLSSPIDVAGEYTIDLPAGVLETADGLKSEAVTLVYTIDPTSEVILKPVRISPEDKAVIEELSEFYIEWDDEIPFDFEKRNVGRVLDEYDVVVSTIDCETDILEESTVMFMLANPITVDGEYRVEIDANAVTSKNEAKNEAIILNYKVATLTGVEAAYSDSHINIIGNRIAVIGYDKVEVYGVSGVSVLTREGDLDVTLAPGLYLARCIRDNESEIIKVLIK